MEQYLNDEWGVIEDPKWLTSPDQIEDYFKDCGGDFLDCGQGFCQEEADILVKIDDQYFSVHILAEIYSAKQDIGDRLYWVESIRQVTWKEIEKPAPKRRSTIEISVNGPVDEIDALKRWINDRSTFKNLRIVELFDTES